jgi:hypothetical protein
MYQRAGATIDVERLTPLYSRYECCESRFGVHEVGATAHGSDLALESVRVHQTGELLVAILAGHIVTICIR